MPPRWGLINAALPLCDNAEIPAFAGMTVGAGMTRGSYECGDVFRGEPPDWCQLARAPGGGWAAICFNPTAEGCHCLTCDKDGKRRFCNPTAFAAAITPKGVIPPQP